MSSESKNMSWARCFSWIFRGYAQEHCENTVSRKCEYGVLEITSDTKVSSHESKTSDLTRLLYHAWFPKPHIHISALTFNPSSVFATSQFCGTELSVDKKNFQLRSISKFRHIIWWRWCCWSAEQLSQQILWELKVS